MQEDESLSDYCVRVKLVVNYMATLGEIVNNEAMIKKVLRYLTLRRNHISIIIEESKDFISLLFDHLVGSLMSCEEILIDSFRESDEKSFSSKFPITKNEDANTRTKSNQGQGRGQNKKYSIGNKGGSGASK